MGSASTLDVELRGGEDPGDLGPWVPVPQSGTPVDELVGEPSYVQYRLHLASSDPDEAPIVREIRLQLPFLFADGFELGDTSAWPMTVP